MHLLHDEQPTAEHRFFSFFFRVWRKGYGVLQPLAYRGLPPPNPRSAAARGYSSAARGSLFRRYDPRRAATRRDLHKRAHHNLCDAATTRVTRGNAARPFLPPPPSPSTLPPGEPPNLPDLIPTVV